MPTVTLAHPTDIDGFRHHARALVQRVVHPDEVQWQVAGEAHDLWDAGADDGGSPPASGLADAAGPAGRTVAGATGPAPACRVPASFLALCQDVLLHRGPQRFALMYRLLWRVSRGALDWSDRLDPDRRRAEQLAREVRHDLHDMRAYVRFTPVETPTGTRHIAWFEPEHHVVAANAPFFCRRFAQMRWAILTPQASLDWDGARLTVGPPGHRRDAPPADAGADLWLTYYQHIFNPARLKVDTLMRQMPQRFWENLPEAVLIRPLVAEAEARAQAMVAAEPTAPRRIKPIRRDAG